MKDKKTYAVVLFKAVSYALKAENSQAGRLAAQIDSRAQADQLGLRSLPAV